MLTELQNDSPEPSRSQNRVSFWRKLGGGSLSISILVHAILLAVGLFWIFQIIPPSKPEDVDFMPKGGGGGQPGAKVDVAMKKRATMTTMNAPRIAAKGASSSFTLPEPDPSTAMTSIGALSSGGMSGGLGGSGSGGGRGDGTGTGFGSGNGPGVGGGAGMKPFAGLMFGKPVQARTIGVVLDVSGSMTGYLPKVIKELDRVAEGSPLILYVGCGIGDSRPENRTYSTVDIDSKRFERFWRLNHDGQYTTLEQGSAKKKVDFTTPIPAESLYRILSTRKNTFYVDYQGDSLAQIALLAKELRDSEAVYWFADFKDAVDEKEAKNVMYRLKSKKQKLYLHSSGGETDQFLKVRDLIAKPTGGDVIDAK